ncbi:MAG: hypothetical protein IJ605_07520 [Prevotella sp.]|nr:hypothetical protein [Prevotella sp.]
MQQNPICSSISRIFISSCLLLLAFAEVSAQPAEVKIPEVENRKVRFFNGISVSADLVGLAQLAFGDYGQYEAALRLNLKDKFFPIFELGYGKANSEDAATRLSYKTSAPYGRVGLDFNLMKNKHDVNRLYGGLRYAYTNYKFDIFCPGVTDPTWGETAEFKAKDVAANYHWLEFVFGLDAKIWGPVRLGWTARYKRRLFHNDGHVGNTWYVPGYGKQGNARLGGTFNVILEL